MRDKNCQFCKIVAKKLPCHLIYEDDNFMAFLDIYPRSIGHTLVIPKNHHQWVYDVPDFEMYWSVVLKITKQINTGLNPSFITYITHGLQMPHAHIHIIPRDETRTMFVPDIIKIDTLGLKKIRDKILKKQLI
jgi:histidine triad (HIT) family protein